jgi:hypothetical protein
VEGEGVSAARSPHRWSIDREDVPPTTEERTVEGRAEEAAVAGVCVARASTGKMHTVTHLLLREGNIQLCAFGCSIGIVGMCFKLRAKLELGKY